MGNFFKTLGKGIIYLFTLPLLVVFLAIYCVISIFGFIIVGFKAMIMFFKGENICAKTSEDIEAERRLDMWLNPIPHVLEEIEKAKSNNQIPLVNVDAISGTPTVTAIQAPKDKKEEPVLTNNKVEEPAFANEPEEISKEQTIEIHNQSSPAVPEQDVDSDLLDINLEEINVSEKKDEVIAPEIKKSFYAPEENDDGVSFEAYDEEDDK